MKAQNVDINNLAKHITLKIYVVGRTRFAIKTWIAKHLIVFGAWIMGCGLEFVNNSGYRGRDKSSGVTEA